MPSLDYDRYCGRVVGQAVSKTKNGFFQVACECLLEGYQKEKYGAYMLFDQPFTSTAFITLSGRNGRNTTQIDALKKSLGWDGEDLRALQNADFSGREVTFAVRDGEDADGNPKRYIAWINPKGMPKATERELSAFNQDWVDLDAPQKDLPEQPEVSSDDPF